MRQSRQVETMGTKEFVKPNRPLAVALCVGLLAVLFGLETKKLPSVFQPSSANFAKDTQLELLFYGVGIGKFGRTPNFQTRNARESDLVVEYSGGPYVTNVRVYFETTGLGFLAPWAGYKAGLVLAVLAAGGVLFFLPMKNFADAATRVTIGLYAAGLIGSGIAGALLTPARLGKEIARAGFAWFLMAPAYGLMWLAYLYAIVAGIAVLRHRKGAAWHAVIAQVLLAYGVYFLVRTIVEPADWNQAGYRVQHMDWTWYGAGYLALVLVVTGFLILPRTRAQLRSSP
jgi:hypothetical protein